MKKDETAAKNAASGTEAASMSRFEFARTSGKEFAAAQKLLLWRSFSNARLVVYAAFLTVNALFFVYYAAIGEYLVSALAFCAAAFMLYILLSGHNFFASALAADEEGKDEKIECRICPEGVALTIGEESENLPLAEISGIRENRKFFLILFKNSKLCPKGVVFGKNGNDVNGLKQFLNGAVK